MPARSARSARAPPPNLERSEEAAGAALFEKPGRERGHSRSAARIPGTTQARSQRLTRNCSFFQRPNDKAKSHINHDVYETTSLANRNPGYESPSLVRKYGIQLFLNTNVGVLQLPSQYLPGITKASK